MKKPKFTKKTKRFLKSAYLNTSSIPDDLFMSLIQKIKYKLRHLRRFWYRQVRLRCDKCRNVDLNFDRNGIGICPECKSR